MLPIQITVRDLPSSPALEDHIRKKVQKLNQIYRRINSCRIVITIPQKHKHQGKLYCVSIDITVPGKELAVNRKLDQDVYVAIRDAFQALQRQVEQYACKRRGDVKHHEKINHGAIKRLFLDEGYGFIQDVNGTEHYFSTANLCNTDFETLKIGDVVDFISVTASDGWQAHHVAKQNKNNFAAIDE